MSEILYSIIIPHYNIPELLERVLESAPYDKDDVEVIVVDDRSDKEYDRLLEVKKKYEASGVRFYRNNNGKKGAGTCRNIGLRHAAGRWLLFADADDRFTDDMYDIISEYKDSESDIIYFKTDSVNISTGEKSYRHTTYNDTVQRYLDEGSHENELYLRQGSVNPWGKMIKRELVVENGIRFDETIVANDVTFSTQTGFYAKTVEAENRVVYVLTAREGSLTRSFDKNIYETRNRIFVNRCGFLKKNLSRKDWKELDLTGHYRLIAMLEEGYPYKDVIKSAGYFALHGVSPVDFGKINPGTAGKTLLSIKGRRNKNDI